MFVPNFKILGRLVPEKSDRKKSLPINTVMEKTKTIYKTITPIYFVFRGIIIR